MPLWVDKVRQELLTKRFGERLLDERLTVGRTACLCSTVPRRWTVSSCIETWDVESKRWYAIDERVVTKRCRFLEVVHREKID